MFVPSYGRLFLIRYFVMITKYTVLDEQWREAKEGKSQRQNPLSITRGAMVSEVERYTPSAYNVSHTHVFDFILLTFAIIIINNYK